MFFGFFIKGPHLLGVIANTKQRGGFLVATTQPIIKRTNRMLIVVVPSI